MAWLTAREYAEKYGISEKTAYSQFREMENARKVGRQWRVWEEEERPAQGLEGGTGHGEVLISSTLEGDYTWINV